jgi:hypothetical protein
MWLLTFFRTFGRGRPPRSPILDFLLVKHEAGLQKERRTLFVWYAINPYKNLGPRYHNASRPEYYSIPVIWVSSSCRVSFDTVGRNSIHQHKPLLMNSLEIFPITPHKNIFVFLFFFQICPNIRILEYSRNIPSYFSFSNSYESKI